MEIKMKNRKYSYSVIALITTLLLLVSVNCKRDFDELELAPFPKIAEVFIDGFSAGLKYAAFGGSKVTAFDVDKEVKYEGSASMRFEVPNFEDPEGGYAGGVFYTPVGRDLSGYTALTFWAKASKSATLDLVGFGNDLNESKYLVSLNNAQLTTYWKKYIIPIPDPTLLTSEQGMFYYSEGPEDGLGYTFWIDEVKFEDLGTIAHKQPKILNGNDETESVVNGLSIPIDGLSVTFNMPNGIDQLVGAAPAYFSFNSSDNNVATVDENGLVTVLNAGTAVITATEGGVDALGSLNIESAGDFVHAPTPTADPEDVISIFSNAYTNEPVDYYNGYWEYSTTTSADFTVSDDDVLFYNNFNFVGIQFTSPTIDASDMTHLHMDVWIPNAVDPADKLEITIVDLGPDGSFNDPNSSFVYTVDAPLETQSWISVDIDLSPLSAKSNMAQIVFAGGGATFTGFYLDNVYLYNDGGGTLTEPAVAAPTPPARDAADVISIYGDAYTNLEGTDYPDWGQATVVSDVMIEGNNTLKFAGLNYQGIELASGQDVSGMESLHLDFWTANSTTLNVYLISPGPVEAAYSLTVPTTGWSSVDIPLSSFSGVDLTDVIQLKFDGNGDIYLDNIYFFTTGGGTGTDPDEAAATPPARDAADVISLFSNAYTNVPVDTWSADWDDSDVADLQVAGDDIKKYTFTNFAGIDFSGNKLDASEMTHFHMDIWTPDAVQDKSLTVKMVDFGGGAAEASNFILTVVHTAGGEIPALATGSWVSIDVPFSAFSGDLTRTDLAQLVLSSNLGTVYIDNLYFYKSGGGSATEPGEAAPAPPARDATDVISIFSGTYTDISGTDFNPNWGQSTVVTTEDIAGNSTLKYASFNYQGTQFGSTQDASAMEYLHVDMWTADATVVKVTPINNSGSPAENLVSLTPINSGQWNSYDIPLTDFTASGMSLNELIQLKFDGQEGVTPSTIYLDNIYFYKTGGATATEPASPAPDPTEDAGDVISLFSDVYTDVTVDTWRTDWSAGTLEEVTIAGNAAKKYSALDFVGIETVANLVDASGMTHLHIDVWSADITSFAIKLVDFGADGAFNGGDDVEHQLTFANPSQGVWVSYDIPLGDFTNLTTREHIAQYILVGQPSGATTIWIDNMYFYSDGGGSTGGGPTAAAPTPPVRDATDVVSIYSDAYTDISVDNFDAGWCGGPAFTEVTIEGNNTLKKNGVIECHGIDFSSNRQDLSEFTHIHFDIYTDDADLVGDVFNVKLVDFAGGNSEASSLQININTGTTPAIVANTWVSVDVDITSLGGVVAGSLTRSDVAQFGITTTNLTNVWYDNVYLYK